MREVSNVSIDTDFLINLLKNYFYTRQLTLLLYSNNNVVFSIAKVFRNIIFLTHFSYFWLWVRCGMFQINTDLLVIYWIINIFTQETLYPSIICEKIGSLHCKRFMKYSLFTKFPLLLKVSEVCNISNKCLLPSKSANKIFLNKTPCTPPSFQYIYIETSTFYHFFTSFHSALGGLYFNPQII